MDQATNILLLLVEIHIALNIINNLIECIF